MADTTDMTPELATDKEARTRAAPLRLMDNLVGEFGARLRHSLVKNSLILAANSALNGALGFVFWIVAARLYSPAEVGLIAAATTAVGLLAVLSSLGLHIGIVRFLPAEKNRTVMINTAVTVVTVFSLAVALVFLLGLSIWSPALLFLNSSPFYFGTFLLFSVLASVLVIQTYCFISLRRPQYYMASTLLTQFVRLGSAVALAAFGLAGLWLSVGLVQVAGFFIVSIFLIKLEPGYRPRPCLHKWAARDMLGLSLGSYVVEIAQCVTPYLMPLLTLALLGAESNAFYYVDARIAAIPMMIPSAVAMSLFAEGSNEPRRIAQNAVRALRLMGLFLIPCLAVMALAARFILQAFGKNYSTEGHATLLILLASTIPLGVNEVFVAVKRVQLKVRATIFVYLSIAACTVGFSYALMKPFGVVGAGLGTLLGQGLVAIVVTIWSLVEHRRTSAA